MEQAVSVGLLQFYPIARGYKLEVGTLKRKAYHENQFLPEVRKICQQALL